MQSSPYHSNKLFDGKINFLNVPKSSRHCAWKLVKDIDEKTGGYIYKLVNNDVESKLIHSKLSILKEKETTESDNSVETSEPTETISECTEVVTPIVDTVTKPIVSDEKIVTPKTDLLRQDKKIDYPSIDNEKKITTDDNLEKNILINEYLLENNSKIQIDFSSFRAKYRNYIISCFDNSMIKVNSKDHLKLLEYSRILDYTPGFLTKINQAIISIQADCENNFQNLQTSFSFKFLKNKFNKNQNYFFNTDKLELINKEGKLFQQFVCNIDSFLPTSDSNIFNYIPNVQFFNESRPISPLNIVIKIVLKLQKIPVHSIDETEVKYLSLMNTSL
jgi:hypothetical protein